MFAAILLAARLILLWKCGNDLSELEIMPADLGQYSRNSSEMQIIFNHYYQDEAIWAYAKILLEILSSVLHSFFTAKKSYDDLRLFDEDPPINVKSSSSS